MKIRYSKKALKFLDRLNDKAVAQIKNAIAGLTQTPPRGDIKIMQGYSDGRRRLRVGSWRVVYRYDCDGRIEILLVLEIGNRGDVYK